MIRSQHLNLGTIIFMGKLLEQDPPTYRACLRVVSSTRRRADLLFVDSFFEVAVAATHLS
jgi:hypothetical protein